MERQDRGLAFMLQYENIAWYENGAVRILDRRTYPRRVEFVTCRRHEEVAQAVTDMVTQSAGPYTAAAMFVITERASSGRPQCAAVSASVTVDMPTASAPRSRAARISAGVSNCGPVKNIYTPSWTVRLLFAAQARATARSSGV